MGINIINFIGILCLTWLFTTGSKPIEFAKKFLQIAEDSDPKDITRKVIAKLINCDLCSGFWIGLIFYQNLLLACIVSITAELFGRLINKIGI